MKNFRIPLIFFLIILVMGFLAYWDEWQTTIEEKNSENKNRIFLFDSEKPDKIVYYNRQESKGKNNNIKVSLEKTGKLWYITSPITAKADQKTVQDLIKYVGSYKYERIINNSTSIWPEFGLLPAKMTTIFEWEGQRKIFYLGNASPVGYKVYSRSHHNNNTYLGSRFILTAINKTLYNFREKTFIPIKAKDITSLSYHLSGQDKIVFKRYKNKPGWQIAAPIPLRVNEDNLYDFIIGLTKLIAIKFFDKPDEKMGKMFTDKEKTNPTIRISWKKKDGNLITIDFINKGDSYYAKFIDKKIIYQIDKSSLTLLRKELKYFRYSDISVTEPGEMKKTDAASKTSF